MFGVMPHSVADHRQGNMLVSEIGHVDKGHPASVEGKDEITSSLADFAYIRLYRAILRLRASAITSKLALLSVSAYFCPI